MVGVDTYSMVRWHAFAEVVSQIRNWLDQLPGDVSGAIAYRNAARCFRQRRRQLTDAQSVALAFKSVVVNAFAAHKPAWVLVRCPDISLSV